MEKSNNLESLSALTFDVVQTINQNGSIMGAGHPFIWNTLFSCVLPPTPLSVIRGDIHSSHICERPSSICLCCLHTNINGRWSAPNRTWIPKNGSWNRNHVLPILSCVAVSSLIDNPILLRHDTRASEYGAHQVDAKGCASWKPNCDWYSESMFYQVSYIRLWMASIQTRNYYSKSVMRALRHGRPSVRPAKKEQKMLRCE